MLGKSKCIESTNPSRDVWGNFNGLMANAFFVNLNELSKNDTKEVEGKFKGLVTDPHIYINNKGKGQFKIKSYHRFLITTNNEDPIKTSVDDRRNLIIRASDEVCGNKAYFSKLYKLLDDVNVIRTCYDYFNSIPNLENFHEIDTPKTEHQTNLAKLSLTPPEQFLIDLCSKKEVNGEFFISTIINRLLIKEKSLSISMVYEFYPMGTLDQINNLENLPLSKYLILDSATRFIDIDGVVLYHNTTIHGANRNIGSDKPLIENIYNNDNQGHRYNNCGLLKLDFRPFEAI
jgi:hypothetical protein